MFVGKFADRFRESLILKYSRVVQYSNSTNIEGEEGRVVDLFPRRLWRGMYVSGVG